MIESFSLHPDADNSAGFHTPADGDASALRAWAEIDLDAIEHNVREIEKLIGDTKIIGIVKANAYGHGAAACARALRDAGVGFFAVACIQEALDLRRQGIDEPILILGYTPPARFGDLVENDLIQTLVGYDYACKLSDYGQAHGIKVKSHLKVDTGMNRTGILYQDKARQYEKIRDVYALEGLDVQGIFSHFPVSDDLGFESRNFTRHQIDLFNEVIDRLKQDGIDPGLRHIQNSYGILNYKDLGMDYCRPGLLYMGVTSDDEIPIATAPDFIPILSLKAKVTLVKTVPDGATVSYGRHYTCQGPRRIASLAIGYADGLSRACSNQNLMVSIRGHLVPIVGNICMDQCMADITGFEDIEEGDTAVLVGKDGGNILTIDAISRLARTINNETLSTLASRVDRVYKTKNKAEEESRTPCSKAK